MMVAILESNETDPSYASTIASDADILAWINDFTSFEDRLVDYMWLLTGKSDTKKWDTDDLKCLQGFHCSISSETQQPNEWTPNCLKSLAFHEMCSSKKFCISSGHTSALDTYLSDTMGCSWTE